MTRTLQPLLSVLVAGALAGASAGGLRAEDAGPSAVPPLGSPDFQPSAARPVGWRGDGSGCYAAATPPTTWSATGNVLWKTEVGTGSSSPVMVGPRVFVTAEPDVLVCLDAAGGQELWRKAHPLSDLPADLKAAAPRQSEHYGDTTPTPVSDGKSVWVFFNTGIVACYDMEGKGRWLRWYDMRLATNYGRHASPVLAGDRLLVHFGPLACLDAATGALLWKTDKAKATYGTPAPARIGGVDVVITPKGHVVRVADGQILASDLGNCMYTSPVLQGRVVYFIDGAMTAVELPEKAGETIACKELWYAELSGKFYASPVVEGGRIHTVDCTANYYVIDAATGQTLRKRTLDLPPAGRSDGPNVYPSLCLAGRHLFVSNDAGTTALLPLGDPGAAVALSSLPAGSGGTPAFSGTRMFVRGGKLLYCIGGR
jgi:outer membrane protein assembly factor BamB